jgi:hypothetical protein
MVSSDKWIAVIGARLMSNPRGAVLSVSLKGSELQLEPLECGDYMMISNLPSLQSHASVVSFLEIWGKGME